MGGGEGTEHKRRKGERQGEGKNNKKEGRTEKIKEATGGREDGGVAATVLPPRWEAAYVFLVK